jgi:hypothetical protein
MFSQWSSFASISTATIFDMTSLPLVDLFPLQSTPPSRSELARQAAMGRPWVQEQYPSVLSVWQALLGQHDHPAGVAFLSALDACEEYKDCLRRTPALNTVPATRAYRKDKRDKWDYTAIDAEMARYGIPLAVGQVLYHGGDWNDGAPMEVGDAVTVPRVLSTTWTPQVALWHARHPPGRRLFVLSVAPGASVKAFAFKNRRTERLGHEREVLVEAGAVLTCTKVYTTSPLPVVECLLSR